MTSLARTPRDLTTETTNKIRRRSRLVAALGEGELVDQPLDGWPETDWSVIRCAAGDDTPSRTEDAWRRLVVTYRKPLEAFLRGCLRGHPRREDVARGAFGYLHEHAILRKADRDKGRFRHFMKGVLRRLASEASRPTRGGLDPRERNLAADVADDGADAETHLEARLVRDWAHAAVGVARERLLIRADRSVDCLVFVRHLGIPPHGETPRTALMEEHGFTRNRVDVAISRGKAELRRLILDEIRNTVAGAEDFDDEQRCLMPVILEDFRHWLVEDAADA